jgi:hypothetical protein
MDRRNFLIASASAAAVPLQASNVGSAHASTNALSLPVPGADGWIALFNGRDLNGWYTWLEKAGRGVAEKRKMAIVEEGMLHVMGNENTGQPVEYGYIATDRDFENVHIRAEYRWGVKRFEPRRYAKRDNGLLYGLVETDKDATFVECQIEEGDVGDCFMNYARGMQDDHPAGLSGLGLNDRGWSAPPDASSDKSPWRKIKDGDFEHLDGWNTVEVIWQGDRAAHILNGRCVNVISDLQQPDPKNKENFIPLTRGRIAIQIEYAEIWYRRIEVKALG